jgi:hypothetical protein
MSLTNRIASADASLATTQWAFRNCIINGNCNIAQRSSFLAAPGTSGYGGPDRYFAANMNSADGEFTQSQGTITYNEVMNKAVTQTVNTPITSTTTTNYWSGISQAIEGYNVYNLLGGPVALSFVFETNVSGTYSVALRDYTATNSYVTTFSATASTPLKVVIPLSMLPSTLTTPNTGAGGLWINVGAINTGTYQTTTLNTWETGNYLSAFGATNWGTTAGNYIALTDLQLEAGYTATPFENRHVNVEIAMCQRYYETGYVLASIYAGAPETLGVSDAFKVTKRITPTGTATNTAYANVSATPTIAALYVDTIYITQAATTAGAAAWTTMWTASAEL